MTNERISQLTGLTQENIDRIFKVNEQALSDLIKIALLEKILVELEKLNKKPIKNK